MGCASVSEPQKSRKGFLIVISYTIKTVVRNDRPETRAGKTNADGEDDGKGGASAVKKYTVTRSYSSIKART